MTAGDGRQPDGRGWRARLGVIVPHPDLVPEAELSAMAPDGVAIHATRVRFEAMDTDPDLDGPVELAALRNYVRPPQLDGAAALLAGGSISALAYAFTSTGYRHGLDVPFARPVPLPGGQHDLELGDVYEWVLANVRDDVDAVFFAGNGFRVAGLIDRLERNLQRPVLSANQVLLWAALRAAGVTDTPVAEYGRLLADMPEPLQQKVESPA